jgi:hypothetical protein
MRRSRRVDQSGDQQPANPAKHDAQSTPLKHKTPGQMSYEPYADHLGVKGSQVQILSARHDDGSGDVPPGPFSCRRLFSHNHEVRNRALIERLLRLPRPLRGGSMKQAIRQR